MAAASVFGPTGPDQAAGDAFVNQLRAIEGRRFGDTTRRSPLIVLPPGKHAATHLIRQRASTNWDALLAQSREASFLSAE